MAFDYSQFQDEHRKWALANFGDHQVTDPLLGIIEEKGELAHAVLKARQGIRGTVAEHNAKALDSIGDIMIYVADLFSCKGWSLAEEVEMAMTNRRVYVSEFMSVPEYIIVLNAQLAGYNYLGAIAVLAKLCEEFGTELDTVVAQTWERVKQRNWKQNPQTGEVSDAKA